MSTNRIFVGIFINMFATHLNDMHSSTNMFSMYCLKMTFHNAQRSVEMESQTVSLRDNLHSLNWLKRLMQLVMKLWNTSAKFHRNDHYISTNALVIDKRTVITASMIHYVCGGMGRNESQRIGIIDSLILGQCASWWRHQMETFSALLALCAGNSPVIGEFPSQRPVTRRFDVFFDLNKPLSKQSKGWWFETLSCPLWRHCNVRL